MAICLDEIEREARRYATARADLKERLLALEADVAKAKQRHIKPLRALAEAVAQHRGRLTGLIEQAPALFEKPRTRLLHGIRVGFQKARGKIAWDDADQVVRLIKKWLPEHADALIRTTETPVRAALARLPAADLRKLGVSVVETGDVVVVEPVEGDIDKLVAAWLQDPAEKGGEVAA